VKDKEKEALPPIADGHELWLSVFLKVAGRTLGGGAGVEGTFISFNLPEIFFIAFWGQYPLSG